jgi:hypothetical protein
LRYIWRFRISSPFIFNERFRVNTVWDGIVVLVEVGHFAPVAGEYVVEEVQEVVSCEERVIRGIEPVVVMVGGVDMVELCGITVFDAMDEVLIPTLFVAVTVKVYDVTLVSPVIVCESTVLPLSISIPPLGIEVTTYPVIGDPPFELGAVNDTIAEVLSASAVAPVGASGTVALTTTETSSLVVAF